MRTATEELSVLSLLHDSHKEGEMRCIQYEAFVQGAMTARGALKEPVRLLRAMEDYMVRWDFEGLRLSVPERAWLAAVRAFLAKSGGVP